MQPSILSYAICIGVIVALVTCTNADDYMNMCKQIYQINSSHQIFTDIEIAYELLTGNQSNSTKPSTKTQQLNQPIGSTQQKAGLTSVNQPGTNTQNLFGMQAPKPGTKMQSPPKQPVNSTLIKPNLAGTSIQNAPGMQLLNPGTKPKTPPKPVIVSNPLNTNQALTIPNQQNPFSPVNPALINPNLAGTSIQNAPLLPPKNNAFQNIFTAPKDMKDLKKLEEIKKETDNLVKQQAPLSNEAEKKLLQQVEKNKKAQQEIEDKKKAEVIAQKQKEKEKEEELQKKVIEDKKNADLLIQQKKEQEKLAIKQKKEKADKEEKENKEKIAQLEQKKKEYEEKLASEELDAIEKEYIQAQQDLNQQKLNYAKAQEKVQALEKKKTLAEANMKKTKK